ncbi:MAG: CRTAC1 family protein [Verrucomicrobiota bacterium]|nr:CRTAC1 family protein [Verrucomicrobiota bacterium]
MISTSRLTLLLLLAVLLVPLATAGDLHTGASFERVSNLPMGSVSGVGSAWADYDRDGYPDLFLGTTVGNPPQSGANRLYHNDRNGTFSVITSNLFPNSGGVIWAGWADYNNDGWLDLYAGKIGNDLLYQNNGNGTFTAITNSVSSDGGGTVGCAWGDYDNDGLIDLISINEGQANSLFHNEGNSFRKVANSILTNSPFSQGAEWGDYDNDGRVDLFLANYQNNRNLLYHNEGAGSFSRVTNGLLVTEAGKFSGGAWGDYDNDGLLDLFVRTYGPRNALYHNNGDGTFGKITPGALASDASHSYGAVWGDYDNDGWLDLFVSNGSTVKRDALYRNNSDGSFTRVTDASLPSDTGEGRSAAWVDYNRDGFLDLWVANTFNTLNTLYRNSGNSNRWLRVQLDGRSSNRSAFGAKVRLRATIGGTNFWQLRQIGGGDMEAHFGLGDALIAELVRVEWPSGLIQEFQNVASSQFLTIAEPSVLSMSLTESGESHIRFQAVHNVLYDVQSTVDFGTWSSFVVISNASNSVSIPVSLTPGKQFFRVREN